MATTLNPVQEGFAMRRQKAWFMTAFVCAAALLGLGALALSRHAGVQASGAAGSQVEHLSRFTFPLHCSNATISGRYGYRMEGNINGVGPFALVGYTTYYPDGRVDGSVTASFNGQIAKGLSFDGTYRYTDGCFGTGVLRAVNGQTILFDFQVVERGKRILLINTDPGSTFNGEAWRID
jgi:hypothetical protein